MRQTSGHPWEGVSRLGRGKKTPQLSTVHNGCNRKLWAKQIFSFLLAFLAILYLFVWLVSLLSNQKVPCTTHRQTRKSPDYIKVTVVCSYLWVCEGCLWSEMQEIVDQKNSRPRAQPLFWTQSTPTLLSVPLLDIWVVNAVWLYL